MAQAAPVLLPLRRGGAEGTGPMQEHPAPSVLTHTQQMALTGGEDMREKLTSICPDANTIYIRGICIKKEFEQLLVLPTACLLPLLRLLLIFRHEGRAEIGTLHPKPVLCVRHSLRETVVCIF